ncbi:MAG: nucleotidyltransferase domain-containing protein, partial [Planctomycetota bacterium]
MMSIERVKELLLPVFERYRAKVVFAYLFGSMAIGEVSPLSDVDIAVYLAKENRESFFDLKLALHADISRALKRNDVDLVVLNTIRNEMLTADVIRNGVVIFDRDTETR